MTVTCLEAMTLWRALERLDRSHRKSPRKPGAPDDGKWGHYDCPPQIQPLLAAIKGSIHAEHPELFETLFGYKPEYYKPTVHAAVQAPNDQSLPPADTTQKR